MMETSNQAARGASSKNARRPIKRRPNGNEGISVCVCVCQKWRERALCIVLRIAEAELTPEIMAKTADHRLRECLSVWSLLS